MTEIPGRISHPVHLSAEQTPVSPVQAVSFSALSVLTSLSPRAAQPSASGGLLGVSTSISPAAQGSAWHCCQLVLCTKHPHTLPSSQQAVSSSSALRWWQDAGKTRTYFAFTQGTVRRDAADPPSCFSCALCCRGAFLVAAALTACRNAVLLFLSAFPKIPTHARSFKGC